MQEAITKSFIAAALLASLAGCATTSTQPPATSLSAVHFFNTATVQDDGLETTAVISTQQGWSPPSNLIVGAVHDTFLRAFVDKKTGATKYQVYTWLRYAEKTWRSYTLANYETPSGPASARITRIGQPDVDCSSRAIGCIFTEHMGFDVSESLFRSFESTARATPSEIWRFRLKPKAGADYDGEITFAEIAGFMAKVDEYKMSKGFIKQ